MTELMASEVRERLVFYVALGATAETVCAAQKMIESIGMPNDGSHRFHVSLAGIKPKDGNYSAFRQKYVISEDKQEIVLK